MILLLSKIILHCTQKYGGEEDFAGHIGGGDLIVISLAETAAQLKRLAKATPGSNYMRDKRAKRCEPAG